MPNNGFATPLGFRIYTPDDWVIRIQYDDGVVLRKGVDGSVDMEEALRVALSSVRQHEIPKDIDARRRRDWNKVKA
tara:strand:+ start:1011 stop:1238 length:228 start_codon:yes stop_codon:yes gene_type:complete